MATTEPNRCPRCRGITFKPITCQACVRITTPLASPAERQAAIDHAQALVALRVGIAAAWVWPLWDPTCTSAPYYR